MPLVEKVARMIDPNLWRNRDEFLSIMEPQVRQGLTHQSTVDALANYQVAISIELAERVVALIKQES